MKLYSYENLKLNEMERVSGGRLSWGCGFAIVGMITATAGAAFVIRGASLAIFLIGESIGIGGCKSSAEVGL
ncbi:MAG: class IIb bacteriocin, lactobin A/cerein 7B family [Flavobacteriales bacterium]